MVEYNINNYLIFELEQDELILQTDTSICTVNNTSMIKFLKIIEEERKEILKKEEIRQYFGDNYIKAIEFMTMYNVIFEKKDLNYNIKKIVFYSKSNDLMAWNERLFSGIWETKNVEFYYCNSIEQLIDKIDSETLLINIHFLYSKSEYKKIRDIAIDKSALLSMNYPYNNNFYFDNIYSEKWKNPCHQCNINNLEIQGRTNNGESDLTYQNLIDIVYNSQSKFQIGIEPNDLQMIKLLDILWSKLSELFVRNYNDILNSSENMENIHYIYEYDIKNKKLNKEISIHWELCDCYE